MKRKTVLFILSIMLGAVTAFAQNNMTVSGTVTEKSTGDPAFGVNVLVKGTTKGTVTDIDGKYSLPNVADNATLVFKSMGMESREIPVSGRSVINTVIAESIQALDELVVIGYGSTKAKDLTSPIAVVKADKITMQPTSSPMAALQGKVAGVQITNVGAPGASPDVRIRGIGSFTSTSPLYVVDGMFYDNIAFLNNNDIAEVSVLKDASAAAIYGVRAANGVVLITTKRGNLNQPATITYDGYVGWQKATNKLKMANSNQYATMLLEADEAAYKDRFEQSIAKWGGDYASRKFGADTDWYDEMLRTAFIHNHSLDISGGTQKSAYSFGLNYLSQEGIMKAKNEYERFNIRSKVDYEVTNWLKVGANVILSHATQWSPNNAAWQAAYSMPGIISVYDDSRTDTEAFPRKYASPSQVGLKNNYSNPIAAANYYNDKSQILQILPTFFAELNLLPQNKLKLRSSYNQDIAFNQNRVYTPQYRVSEYQKNDESTLQKNNKFYRNWIWDNTLTYTDSFGKHGLTAMAGHSSREDNYRYLWGKAANVPGSYEEYLYLNQGNEEGRTTGDDGTTYRGLSFFGRVNYDYDNRYILSATFRADGSSKYQEKWGYFPSIGAAWVISNENFMRGQRIFDNLKLRGSWGKLGNDKISASDGFSSIATGNTNSGIFGPSSVPGYTSSSFFSWLRWEVVNETNVGVDLAFLDRRLTAEVDYFYRLTENAVINTTLPLGAGTLLRNSGEIENSGFEVSLNWNDRIGKDFSYYVGANFSTLKNRVKSLNGLPYIYGGSAELRTISQIGKEMYSYYGYKVEGVYQNQAEIDKHLSTEGRAGVEPGDFRFQDLNHDGIIDDKDRQILGSNIPSFSYAINGGFNWKGLEFNMAFQGQAGNEIINRKRQMRVFESGINYDAAYVENRWTGEGSTNSYPSAKGSLKSRNMGTMNSFYVEDADYFRIQTLQLAYNFKDLKINSVKLPDVRLSFTVDRPYTWFSSNGFTPEITDISGWDTQVYPLAATYTIGLRLTY